MSAILAIPGWGADGNVWSKVESHLPYRFRKLSWRELLADHQRAIAREGNTIVLGWSLGALLALRSVLQNQEGIAALVLVSGTACFTGKGGYPGADPRALRAMQIQMRKNRPELMAQFARQCFEPEDTPAAQAEFLDQMKQWEDDDLLLGLQTLAKLDLREQLAELKVPVLLIHGEQDRVVPLASAQYLAQRLGRGRLHVLAERGHGLPLTAPGLVAELIRDFCR